MAYDFRHSFGPGQITGVAIVPGEYFVVDELRNFSISSHFDKQAIRRLGHRLPIGWATGSGTIAGTLVFAQLTRGAFWRVRRYAGTVRVAQGRNLQTPQQEQANINALQSGIRPEQLPPFELMWVHASESGQMAISRLYDVTITDTGSVKGQNSQFTEEQLQYKARFHEQIRLHRSLSTEQMIELANEAGMDKKRGFIDDPRRANALLDRLMNVSGIDTGDLGEYLIAETEEVEESDTPTAMSIADTGNVVFQEQPDDHSDSTSQHEDLRAAQRANRHFTHKIEETVIVEKDDGSLTTDTLTAHLELKNNSLYLNSDPIDNTDNHEPVVQNAEDDIATVDSWDYYGPFMENSTYTRADTRFNPSYVHLTVTGHGVERAGDLSDATTEVTTLPPVGEHKGAGRFTREIYEVTSGSPTTLLAKALPPGGPEGKETGASPGGTVFEYAPDGPALQYQDTNLRRTSPLPVNAGSGSVTKHDDQHWTFSRTETGGAGTTVLDCTVDLQINDDEIEAVFTGLNGEDREIPGDIGSGEPIDFHEAKVQVDTTYDAAQDKYVFQQVSVTFETEDRTCFPPDGATSAHEITGTFDGRDVAVTVETDGSYNGSVGDVSVSGTGWTELVGSGTDVEFKATDQQAQIRLKTSRIEL